jgi:thioesterase domain-containing protein
MGGVVAFEMARQLRALGGEVALLALIDSRVAPRAGAPAQEDDDVTLLLGLARDLGLAPEEFGLTREELLPLSPDGQLAAILSRVDESHRLLSGLGIEAVRRMFDVFKSNLRALRGYAPQVYAGRVTLFRAAERGEWGPPGGTMSWDAWAAGGVQTCPVPGDHYTMMREPHVRVLAENLARHLARAA